MAHEKGDSFYKALNKQAGYNNIELDSKGESDFRSLTHNRGDKKAAEKEINKYIEEWTDNGQSIEDWRGCYLWKVSTFRFAPGVVVYLKVQWIDRLQNFAICSCHKEGV